MSKIKLSVTKEGMEEALEDSGDLVLPPKGYHLLRLEEVVPGHTQGDKDRPNIKMQWKIVGVGREGKKVEENYMHIFDYVSFSEASQWKRDEVAAALGLKMKGKAKAGDLEMEIDPGKPGTVIGTVVLGRIKIDAATEQYDASPKIAKLLPVPDETAVPDAFGEDDDTSEDAPESDPFTEDEDGEDSEEETEAGDEEDGELLTREDLEGMEPKELAETASEFDIDISDFTGKGKSKAAQKKDKMKQVIDAILEAQGDGGEDEDDDEDPF